MKQKLEIKYNSTLNKIIQNIIANRRLTNDQLSNDIFDTLCVKFPGEIIRKYQVRRNYIVYCIRGYHKLTYDVFKLVMEDVLNEIIPNDPEIIHSKNLGRGRDLRGAISGSRLTAIECIGTNERDEPIWRCVCTCGNEILVTSNNLKSGNTKSCGCYKREILSTLAHKFKTHGMKGSREYTTWQAIIQRCTNQNNDNYHLYGGRGITVCDRWLESFENFYDDMGDRPEGMSIDRRDNDGNYEPGNCRWATPKEQTENRRNTLKFEDGSIVSAWAYENNLNSTLVRNHFYVGRSKNEILEKLLTKKLE